MKPMRWLCCAALLAACGSAGHGDLPAQPVPAPPTYAEPGPASVQTEASDPVHCPKAQLGREQGRLSDRALTEVSGLAASRRNPGVLWVHNDSGAGPRVFAVGADGSRRRELVLEGARAIDWEDISVGPGPTPNATYVYVADIGDNEAARASVQIYRFEEPMLGVDGQGVLRVVPSRIDLRYDDGPHDAETLLIDPRGGDLYVVAKAGLFGKRALAGIYRVESVALREKQATAQRVGAVQIGPATAGDVLPDGSGIALRNYFTARFWPRAAGQPLHEALSGPSCELPLADVGRQGEAFGFSADGAGYFTTTEGIEQPLFFYRFE